MSRVLDIKGLEGGYGSVQILYGIDMYVDEGEFGQNTVLVTRGGASRRGSPARRGGSPARRR